MGQAGGLVCQPSKAMMAVRKKRAQRSAHSDKSKRAKAKQEASKQFLVIFLSQSY
jgi:hypothetical protein